MVAPHTATRLYLRRMVEGGVGRGTRKRRGTWQERTDARNKFNDYIESKYGIIRWTDKLLNKAGELDFACMEKPKSIHLSREFYPHWNGEEEVNTLEEFFG